MCLIGTKFKNEMKIFVTCGPKRVIDIYMVIHRLIKGKNESVSHRLRRIEQFLIQRRILFYIYSM